MKHSTWYTYNTPTDRQTVKQRSWYTYITTQTDSETQHVAVKHSTRYTYNTPTDRCVLSVTVVVHLMKL